jgi:hypothetical protein
MREWVKYLQNGCRALYGEAGYPRTPMPPIKGLQGVINHAILSPTGTAQNGASWNAATKTLTINLATALANRSSFLSQDEVKLVIAYYGTANINTLGIVSANLN